MRRTYLKVVWMMALLLLPASLLAQELAAIPPLRSPVVDVTGTLDAGRSSNSNNRRWPCNNARARSCRS